MKQRLFVLVAALALGGAALLAQTADMGGQWDLVYNPPSGHVNVTLYVTQQGTSLRGNAETEGGEFPITGSMDAKSFTVSYTRPDGGQMVKIVLSGTIDGDNLTGTAKVASQEPVPLEGNRTSH